MALVITFLFGIGNFALHKAVIESGHPLLRQMPWLFDRMGGRFSLMFEFLLLSGAMLLIDSGSTGWALAYAIYSLLNGLSAWMILSGRM